MRLASALLLSLLVLAGCGGDDKPGAGADKPATTAAAASPQELLRAVEAALHEAETFHIEGTMTDENGETRLEGDVGQGAVRLSVENDGASIQMVVLGDDEVYLRADGTFWKKSDAPPAAQDLLADRWAQIPADDEFTELAEFLQPDVLADCLDDGTGTMSVRNGTLDGMPVVMLVDAGDKPGTTPGELTVSATRPQLPLRIHQTGPGRPGGPPPSPECRSSSDDDEDEPTTAMDLRLSQWDKPVEIEAPPDALDLEALARQARGESTV